MSHRFLTARVVVAAWLYGHAALSAQAVTDATEPAAAGLWRSFLEVYRKESLEPLAADVLDEKARASLIATAGPRFRTWKPDHNPSFRTMVAEMATSDGSVTQFGRVEETLKDLLPKIDRYGHYKTASDIAQLRNALRQNSGGLHLALEVSPDGRILCFPMDDGPAALAGVKHGAVLLEMDGRSVEGKSLAALQFASVGPPGSPIHFKVRQPHGKIEELDIIRTDKPVQIIKMVENPLGITLRILRFDAGTAKTTKSLLASHPKLGRLTLDLRGNSGGLREEALYVASMFFPEGTVLCHFSDSSGPGIQRDGNEVTLAPTSIRILQDQRTASAAELLIAVLKEGLPEKTRIFGTRTYGKAHSTLHTLLEGGGEIAVTETRLSTAADQSWDQTGIPPDEANPTPTR